VSALDLALAEGGADVEGGDAADDLLAVAVLDADAYGGAADGATANLINIVQFTNEATTMDCKYVDKVRVRVNNITFDAGTKITVWGVRI